MVLDSGCTTERIRIEPEASATFLIWVFSQTTQRLTHIGITMTELAKFVTDLNLMFCDALLAKGSPQIIRIQNEVG